MLASKAKDTRTVDIIKATEIVLSGALMGTVEPDAARQVISMGVPLVAIQPNGSAKVVGYPTIEAATGINYNRGWLLIRQAWLNINDPAKLVDLTKAIKPAKAAQVEACKLLDAEIAACKDSAKAERLQAIRQNAEFNMDRHVVAPAVLTLRTDASISWGEISVRLNLPEATCRRAFNMVSDRKDRGLRIGKGGRWAYGAGELYMDNRKKEGAHIPVDFKMRPRIEDLMNFIPKDKGANKNTNKATDTKRRNQIVALLAKAYDAAVDQAERHAFEAKAYELCAKYGFDTADFKFAKVRTEAVA